MTHLMLVNHAAIRYTFATYSHNISFYYAENEKSFMLCVSKLKAAWFLSV